MKRLSVRVGFSLLVVMILSVQAKEQQSVNDVKSLATKLEAFQTQTGAVVIKGYTTVGRISAIGTVEVTAMEITDASTGIKQAGVSIEVKESGRLENADRSFIDYDEIESLLIGIDYVSRATSEITKLEQFEATYKTKGNFRVVKFSGVGKLGGSSIEAAVSCGTIRLASAYLSIQQLNELRALIEKAKQKIDLTK